MSHMQYSHSAAGLVTHRQQHDNCTAAGLVTHATAFRELTLRELRFVRVPAPRGLSFAAGVASLRPAYGCLETNPTSF